MNNKNPIILMKTTQGEIKLELEPEKAPATVENFLTYARSGHYEGTIFHRVISNFMIQGGGMTADMKSKTTRAPIKNEADNGLRNDRGTIAMARTQEVDSATSQFFINVTDNDFLNHRDTTPAGFGYAVFGHVIEGIDTVDAIRQVPTKDSGFHQDVPKEPVMIEKVSVIE